MKLLDRIPPYTQNLNSSSRYNKQGRFKIKNIQ